MRAAWLRFAATLAVGLGTVLAAEWWQQGQPRGSWTFRVCALRIPLLVEELAPLACLVGVAWALAAARVRGELDAMRTSGLGPARAAMALALGVGIPVGIIELVDQELLVPRAELRSDGPAARDAGIPVPAIPAVAVEGHDVVFGDGTAFRLQDGRTPQPVAASSPPPAWPRWRPDVADRATLAAAMAALERAGHPTAYWATARHARDALAAACPLAAFLGALIGWRWRRGTIGGALLVAVSWAGLTVLGLSLAAAGAVPPAVGAWAPHGAVALTLLGAHAIRRPHRRR